jgi:NAD(P)-dependent dehydrogenase (short-subunit alcohol dehydrogenase family)
MSGRKVAIVTGSATGVGAATALALAGRGYDVLVNYSKSESEAQASLAACRAAGADAQLVRGDVAQDADCKAIVRAAVERWGRVDALRSSTTPASRRLPARAIGMRSMRRRSSASSASMRWARFDGGMHLGATQAAIPGKP